MQEYKDIDIDSLVSDGPATINKNFHTLLSNNAGTAFPTTNLYAGMTCYRSDEKKVYTLGEDLSTWIVILDLSLNYAVSPCAASLSAQGIKVSMTINEDGSLTLHKPD